MAWLKGWLAAAHPFPLTLVLALTALVGVASADGEPDAQKLALLLVAMALSQLAIGWSNDYLDRETDATHQPWKPIPSGLVDAKAMPLAIGIVLAGSLATGVLLGPVPLLLLIAGTACGLAYNLGLKDTSLSALPFVVALGLLPAFVWASLDVYVAEFLLLYAIGVPLALAAHVANTVPDIETDMAAGRRGLATVLGRGRSLGLIGVCMVVPPMLAVISQGESVVAAVGVYVLLCACGAVAYRRGSTGRATSGAFAALRWPASSWPRAGWRRCDVESRGVWMRFASFDRLRTNGI